jgi:predicted Rossmann fold nucleotide-binding protein DprA/Smf involved in DNA uptake
MPALADRTYAVLGLCSRLADSDEAVPLRAREYWELADRVGDPGTLVGRSVDDLVADGFVAGEAERYVQLLERAGGLALALEALEQDGVWTLVDGDEGYPARLRTHLGSQAPPLLHGSGSTNLLEGSTLGIVGSRNVDEDGAEVARAAARHAVEQGSTIISGGARGVDQLAMGAALDAGGATVGVLAESLLKRLREPEARAAIHEDRLCLLTPYKPDAGFSVAAAMGRNKLIYALSDVTLVVATDKDSGGTWAGATESLKKGYGAVGVWRGPGEGPGNAGLLGRGASAVEDIDGTFSAVRAAPDEQASQLRLGL